MSEEVEHTNEQEPMESVDEFLESIRKEHGKILAHPLMYVSALHNPEGCYPVDQTNPFFTSHDIEFIKLPSQQPVPLQPSVLKYVVSLDETGAYRHSLVVNE